MTKLHEPPPLPTDEERAQAAQRLLQHMPEAMRKCSQWLLWRAEVVPKRDGVQKVPYWVNGARRQGDLGGADDRERLATLDAAVERFTQTGRFHGVGFAFLQGDGLVGIDLDDLVDAETGEMREHHQAIIKACSSYTERSPSGNGLHIICAGLTDSFKHDPVGVEVYCGGRYFTCTGVPYKSSPQQVQPLEPYALEYMRTVVQRSKDRAREEKRTADAGKAPRAGREQVDQGPAAPAAPGGAGGRGDDYRRVNDAALQALDRWVPVLFPSAERKDYGWRVTSKALGRDLQEDLQLSEQGVMDFGEEQGMTPIDVVIKWAPGLGRPKDAMLWLAGQLGLQGIADRPARRAATSSPRRTRSGATGAVPDDHEAGEPPEFEDVPPDEDEAERAASGKGGGRRRSRGLDRGVLQHLIEGFALVYGTDDVWVDEHRTLMKVKNLRLLYGTAYVNGWLAHPERRLLMPDQIRFEPGVERMRPAKSS